MVPGQILRMMLQKASHIFSQSAETQRPLIALGDQLTNDFAFRLSLEILQPVLAVHNVQCGRCATTH